jgi:hypothetical protein
MKTFLLFTFAILATTMTVSAQQTTEKVEVKKEAKTKNKDRKNDNWNGNNNWNNWGGGERVQGEGPSITESRDAKDFKGFKSSISADITLKQTSGSYKITIDGQKNIIALMKFEVVEGILKIGFEKGYSVNYREPLKITIEAPSFTSMGMAGSGNVRVDGALTGDKMYIGISGSGDFDLDNLQYGELSVGISGSGDVHLSGSAESVELSISGSGDVKADDLKTKKANCRVSGSGNISLNVSKELDATISGSGDIRYSGSPASVRTRVSGSGDIKSQ